MVNYWSQRCCPHRSRRRCGWSWRSFCRVVRDWRTTFATSAVHERKSNVNSRVYLAVEYICVRNAFEILTWRPLADSFTFCGQQLRLLHHFLHSDIELQCVFGTYKGSLSQLVQFCTVYTLHIKALIRPTSELGLAGLKFSVGFCVFICTFLLTAWAFWNQRVGEVSVFARLEVV